MSKNNQNQNNARNNNRSNNKNSRNKKIIITLEILDLIIKITNKLVNYYECEGNDFNFLLFYFLDDIHNHVFSFDH